MFPPWGSQFSAKFSAQPEFSGGVWYQICTKAGSEVTAFTVDNQLGYFLL